MNLRQKVTLLVVSLAFFRLAAADDETTKLKGRVKKFINDHKTGHSREMEWKLQQPLSLPNLYSMLDLLQDAPSDDVAIQRIFCEKARLLAPLLAKFDGGGNELARDCEVLSLKHAKEMYESIKRLVEQNPPDFSFYNKQVSSILEDIQQFHPHPSH
eukprot:GHVN01026344.1.p2 GENE.GHVN01026344.1~~GHVN01026344.1.p2  ORF type:complete len:157 (-),score=24.70 GHVN01026344.1:1547-2017(-)